MKGLNKVTGDTTSSAAAIARKLVLDVRAEVLRQKKAETIALDSIGQREWRRHPCAIVNRFGCVLNEMIYRSKQMRRS